MSGGLLTLGSDGPKTSTRAACSSWLCALPGEATHDPVRRTAAPMLSLYRPDQQIASRDTHLGEALTPGLGRCGQAPATEPAKSRPQARQSSEPWWTAPSERSRGQPHPWPHGRVSTPAAGLSSRQAARCIAGPAVAATRRSMETPVHRAPDGRVSGRQASKRSAASRPPLVPLELERRRAQHTLTHRVFRRFVLFQPLKSPVMSDRSGRLVVGGSDPTAKGSNDSGRYVGS